MIDAPGLDKRMGRKSPYRNLQKARQSSQSSVGSSSTGRKLALAVAPNKAHNKAYHSSQSSVGSSSTRRKIALAVDPFSVARSVSGSSSVISRRKSPPAISPLPSQQYLIKKRNMSPTSRRRRDSSPRREPPASTFQPLFQPRQPPARAVVRTPTSPLRPVQTLACDSMTTATSGTTSWHDERLMKSLTFSDTFQKRLEDQAAEAIRKAEEKTIQEYEKKLKNCLKQIEVIEKRKKNDLRLVQLRKKTELEKIEKEFEVEIQVEKERLAIAEAKKLKKTQSKLKNAVLHLKRENRELQECCREIANENKQIMAELESKHRVQQEVEHHGVIISQMDDINRVFQQAHEAAVEDLRRLEDDCKRETKERKKIQKWIASLMTLMDERCHNPRLLNRVHKIHERCKAQRELVFHLRRSRKRSSKRSKRSPSQGSQQSQRSGATSVLKRKVRDMRKQARASHHILEDRANLTAELAQRREQTRQLERGQQEEIQQQQQNLQLQQGMQNQPQVGEDVKRDGDDHSVVDCTRLGLADEPSLLTDGSSLLTDNPSLPTDNSSLVTDNPSLLTDEQVEVIKDDRLDLQDDPIALKDDQSVSLGDPLEVKNGRLVKYNAKDKLDFGTATEDEAATVLSLLKSASDDHVEAEPIILVNKEKTQVKRNVKRRPKPVRAFKVKQEPGGQVSEGESQVEPPKAFRAKLEPEEYGPKVSARIKKKTNKRHQEIQKILSEMKSLDCREDPPTEIYV